jgi:NADH-quinone oxidoreductase subunit G
MPDVPGRSRRPKPIARTFVTDGMVVRTTTEKVTVARQAILEFLLANHPLDCPVCDQAGECKLQEFYMQFGQYDSTLLENKLKKHKAMPIGPHIMLDSERCILCSRCVRFVDEITKTMSWAFSIVETIPNCCRSKVSPLTMPFRCL